jgi:hypothetical protein
MKSQVFASLMLTLLYCHGCSRLYLSVVRQAGGTEMELRPRNGPGISHKSGKPQKKTIEMTDRKVAIHSHPTMFGFDFFSIFLNVAGRHTIPHYN